MLETCYLWWYDPRTRNLIKNGRILHGSLWTAFLQPVGLIWNQNKTVIHSSIHGPLLMSPKIRRLSLPWVCLCVNIGIWVGMGYRSRPKGESWKIFGRTFQEDNYHCVSEKVLPTACQTCMHTYVKAFTCTHLHIDIHLHTYVRQYKTRGARLAFCTRMHVAHTVDTVRVCPDGFSNVGSPDVIHRHECTYPCNTCPSSWQYQQE